MKLRFVKIFTSRENEIEKKEEEGRHYNARCHPASPRPEPMPHLLLPPSFLSLPLPPPHQPAATTAPACPPPRVGRAMSSSYPCHSCSASPFLLHKLPKQKSVAVVTWRSTQLADPASRSNYSGHPARSPPLSLHPIGCWLATLV